MRCGEQQRGFVPRRGDRGEPIAEAVLFTLACGMYMNTHITPVRMHTNHSEPQSKLRVPENNDLSIQAHPLLKRVPLWRGMSLWGQGAEGYARGELHFWLHFAVT